MLRALSLCLLLAGCFSSSSGPIIGSGGTPATAYNDNHVDLLDDPKIEYRDGPAGFPIPVDAVSKGTSFVVPRGYHMTARMQTAKLTELGFAVESTHTAANAYKLQAKKGDRTFVATITSPRGAMDDSSSTLDVVELH